MKARLKRIFSKARWFLLIIAVGIVLDIAGVVFDLNYITHDGSAVLFNTDDPADVTVASVNGGRIAFVDNRFYPRVASVADAQTGKSLYTLHSEEIPEFEGSTAVLNGLALADDGTVYAHSIYWVSNSDNLLREDIIKFTPDGKYDDRLFTIDHRDTDKGLLTQRSPILSNLSFQNGKLRFLYRSNSAAKLYEADHSTGILTECEDLSNGGRETVKVISTDKGYLLIRSDGKVYDYEPGRPLGEPIYTCRADIKSADIPDIFDLAEQIGDRLYVTTMSARNVLCELRDGKLVEIQKFDKRIYDIKDLNGSPLIINTYKPFVFENGAAREVGLYAEVSASSLFAAWLSYIINILMLIGFIGLVGWLIVKKKTLLTKMLLVMIPLLLGISVGLFFIVFSRMSGQYFESRESEITAVCELASADLDGYDFSEMTSLETTDSEKFIALRDKLFLLCNGNQGKWGSLYSMYIVLPTEQEMYRVLVGTDALALPNERAIRFFTEEELSANMAEHSARVSIFKPENNLFGFTDTAQFEGSGKIYGSDGKVCAYLVVTAGLYNVTMSRFNIMGDVLVYVLLIAVVLIGVTTLFAIRISKLIRKTTDTVSKIAGGDLSARVMKTSNDEFGEIYTQVNKMAQNLETMFEEKDKNEKFYYKFVPKKFSELLGKENLTDLTLGDAQSREFSVLFCDIRAFSLNSEMMTAKEIFKFVNVIYGIAGPIIRRNGGFVDKYIGDAVMALFESADQAVKTGIELYRSIVLDPETAKDLGISSINIGVGIHTGMAEIGIVGEEERLSGTVISDTVNLSSRLESLTKTYKTAMLISKDTLDRMQSVDELDMRYLGMVQVAGVNEVKSLYEVLDCLPDEERALRRASKDEFREAIRLFHMGERAKAAEMFKALIDSGKGDHVAKMYLDYIHELSDDDKGSVFRFVRK